MCPCIIPTLPSPRCSMRTAASGPRGEPHPLARGRTAPLPAVTCNESGCSLVSPSGSRRRRSYEAARRGRGAEQDGGGAAPGAAEALPPAPGTPQQRAPLNPVHALLLLPLSCSTLPASPAPPETRPAHPLTPAPAAPPQCAHFAAFHRLPTQPSKVVDQRPSRAYIGQVRAQLLAVQPRGRWSLQGAFLYDAPKTRAANASP